MTFTFPVIPEALVSAVEDMGFEAQLIATGGQEAAVLSVGGMTCGACSSAVESALRAVPGVSAADVSVVTGKAQVGVAGVWEGGVFVALWLPAEFDATDESAPQNIHRPLPTRHERAVLPPLAVV